MNDKEKLDKIRQDIDEVKGQLDGSSNTKDEYIQLQHTLIWKIKKTLEGVEK